MGVDRLEVLLDRLSLGQEAFADGIRRQVLKLRGAKAGIRSGASLDRSEGGARLPEGLRRGTEVARRERESSTREVALANIQGGHWKIIRTTCVFAAAVERCFATWT